MMLIDTHCHLDAREFDADRDIVLKRAQQNGVAAMVIPAIERANFMTVAQLAQQYPQCAYALGIHPLFVDKATNADLDFLSQLIAQKLATDNPPVAIGEIGLDFFVPGSASSPQRELQEHYFVEQLKLARQFKLPVLLHVRRAIDDVLKHLRRIKVIGGIAHAFNGSHQQANEFIRLGFKLGFGGAMTHTRALRIRKLATTLPLEAIVLETDAPDIPPAWLNSGARNSPAELLGIAQTLAELRGLYLSQVIDKTAKNTLDILPRIVNLYTQANALHQTNTKTILK